ncbi:hypothetical protein PHPALM_28718 [Phytophthora palmivora]|uniref:Uncharacterized protein n=1 Tax=Phytophthora palmivora TaxID=4796 RepID=A0A2P4X9D0_9STRA|nr:hypothetical protein PHPALM_28718 [Phytophthora palmivora]
MVKNEACCGRCTVTVATVIRYSHNSLCRRPVIVATDNNYILGQAVTLNHDKVRVKSDRTQFVASIADVTEVAPVVALLLLKVVFEKEEWSLSEVETIGVHVLDRILGRSGSSPTRDVGEILDGLIALECFPDTHSIRRWIDHLPARSRCFIYNTPSITLITSMEGLIRGPSQEPHIGDPRDSQNQNQEASDNGCTIFVPYADDEAEFATDTVTTPKPLESRLSHTSIHARAIHTQEEIEEPASYRVRLHESSPDVDMGAFIVDKLKADPVPLNRFLQVRESSIAKQVRSIQYENTYRQHVCITLLNLQSNCTSRQNMHLRGQRSGSSAWRANC